MKPDGLNQEPQLPQVERVAYLIAGYLQGTLTEAEHDELDEWVVASDENTRLFEDLTDENNLEFAIQWFQSLNQEKALHKIKEKLGLRKEARPFLQRLAPYAIAASLIILAVSIYLVKSRNLRDSNPSQPSTPQTPATGNRAVLTLTNGRTLILDSSGTGLPLTDNGTTIRAGKGNEIIYENNAANATGHHTISIPHGSQYRLLLPDGSKVWLNAATSLRLPVTFSGTERHVELKGEACFQVAADPQRPFTVHLPCSSGDTGHVTVTGTRFNVRSYPGDTILSATLLEGSVKVTRHQSTAVLKPGQKAVAGKTIRVAMADTESETGWMKKMFVFRNEPVASIVAEIARWYDLEVEFSGRIPYHLTADFERDLPLQTVLKRLELTRKVHFKLDGRKLIVTP
jgi:transmembrane sensor